MGKKPSSFILYKIHTYSYVICVFLFSFLAVIHITNVKIFICLLLESCFRQPEVDRQHSQLSDTGNRQQLPQRSLSNQELRGIASGITSDRKHSHQTQLIDDRVRTLRPSKERTAGFYFSFFPCFFFGHQLFLLGYRNYKDQKVK